MNSTLSFLLLVVLAAVSTQAFAPAVQPARLSTSLNINNAYTRGGKPSWTFETETMYIDEAAAPKETKKPAKKTPAKKDSTPPSKMTIGKFFASPF